MNLNKLQPNTRRRREKRVGRGGKRGTFSGGGSKGQKSRAGASVKPGFRGGDNRIWQLFPKQRGASKKPGSKSPHKKHRYFQYRYDKPVVFNLSFFNQFSTDGTIDHELLVKKGVISNSKEKVKILGDGQLKKGLEFKGFELSKSARTKLLKAGGRVK